jgi:hypothetical protein
MRSLTFKRSEFSAPTCPFKMEDIDKQPPLCQKESPPDMVACNLMADQDASDE